jgi:hypothetical protein
MMANATMKRTLRTPKSDDNYLVGLWEKGEYTTLNAAYNDAIRRGVKAIKRERKE